MQALVAAATDADGTAPLSEHVLLHLRHGGDSRRRAPARRATGTTLVGFAHLDLTDPVAGGAGELVVHPAHRRSGLGTRIVRGAARAAPPTRAGGCGSGRTASTPARSRWPRGLGFTQARVLWQMRRSLLAPLAEPRLPDGVRLRPFVVGADEPEFLRVNNAAFDWHPEQGGWDLEQVKLREAEPWFDPPGFLLAVDADDRLLGFHWTKVHGGADPGGALARAHRRGVRAGRGPVRARPAPRRGAHRGRAAPPARPRLAPGDAVRRGRQRRRRPGLPRSRLHPVGHGRLLRPLTAVHPASPGSRSGSKHVPAGHEQVTRRSGVCRAHVRAPVHSAFT